MGEVMICKECGKEFEIVEEEKNFYISKGLELPKRCRECRIKRRKDSGQKRKTENTPETPKKDTNG